MKSKLYITAEAYNDMYETKHYIQHELFNQQAANDFIANIKREIATLPDFPFKYIKTGMSYRGKMIHKRAYKSYLILYIIDDKNAVHVLRVLKDIMDWKSCIENVVTYHYIR